MKIFLLAVLLIAQPVSATLIDQGNGLVYDSTQEIYWTQNAGLNPIPDVWGRQMGWAQSLSYLGLTDWHLPTIENVVSLYDELERLALCHPNSLYPDRSDCSGNVGPFTGLTEFWTSTRNQYYPYFFTFYNKSYTVELESWPIHAWAVHAAAVPELPAWVLVMMGLGYWLGNQRHKFFH